MTTNVRFYKLEVLPNFDTTKTGIFVHVTGTMENKSWFLSDGKTEVNPESISMADRLTLVQWLTERHIDSIASGLWFGGENGWELLTNDTSSGAITAAIDALNAGGFTQATIGANPEGSESATDSILTIKGIKEVKGKIEQDNTNNVNIAIDGVYSQSNKIATISTVTNAINGLNTTETIQAVTKTTSGNNTTLTFKGVQESNGVIAQGDGAETFIVGDAKLKIQIGSATTDVFSANAQSDSTIKLNENVFKKDENNVISVITKNNDVSSTNPLVTQNDINGLAGAMHYRGGVTSVPTADNSTKKGDVWIVTTAFGGYEAGDMFIARADGGSATFDTVQGNLTLGTGDGQIAKNVGILSTNNNVVVATENGIKTIGITEDDLTGTQNGNNNRKLTYVNGTADTTGDITLYHSATITDTFKVIGKDFTKSINISSNNRSIEITRNAGEDNSTGVIVDLVWNTSMDLNN